MKDEGVEFVQLHVERRTKTQSGCEGQQECAFNPIMHALGGYHCPVDLSKKYKRSSCSHEIATFYLQPARDLSNIIFTVLSLDFLFSFMFLNKASYLHK